MIIWAIINSQFDAIHQWQDGESKEWDMYLRWKHRHLFVVRVWVRQRHDNRDIEYYNFKGWLDELLRTMVKPVYYSCEMYCKEIAKTIQQAYEGRPVKIEVLEDGREGAYCEFEESELARGQEA